MRAAVMPVAARARMRAVAAGILRRWGGIVLGAAAGVWWLLFWTGTHVLDPTNVGWVMSGEDWTQHFLGWQFFRNEAWALPLGKLSGYVHPIGTTVGFTDSNPWVSVLLKPLSPLLPEDFQFIGPWLGLCFALQGAVGAWLVRRLGGNVMAQAGAGALFAMAPILIVRVGHEALCAHFILVLLAGLHLVDAPNPPDARRHVIVAGLLVVLAAGLHPYLAVMTLALAISLLVKLGVAHRPLPRVTLAIAAAGYVALTAGTFALFGYFTGGGISPGGFGWFNAELLALVSSRGKSHVIPALPASRPHLEGYGFLGLGALVVVVAAIASTAIRFRRLRALPWRRATVLLGMAGAMAFFSLANEVRLANVTLFKLDVLYERLGFITEAFRGSGRFIWPLHYTILVGSVAMVVWAWRTRPLVAGVLFVLAAGAQALDFELQAGNLFVRAPINAGLRAPLWSMLGAEYRHLVLIPPQVVGAPSCAGELPGGLHHPLAYLAYRQEMTINSGYVARLSPSVERYCQEIRKQVGAGELDPDSVYILGAPSFRALRASNPAAACGRVDGFFVCVSGERETEVRRLLEEGR